MTTKEFEQLISSIEKARLGGEPIRSFQLVASKIKAILSYYKDRLKDDMKSHHPEIYSAFQNNNQAFKLAQGGTVFEQSLFDTPLSKIDKLSLNHQTNKIIYNLDLLIKTPDRYTTLFELYKRTKTPSFGGTVNQKSLYKLEVTLTAQLEQLHHYYQEIRDGMSEIDQLRHPKPTTETNHNPAHNPLHNPPKITEAAYLLFKKMNLVDTPHQKRSVKTNHKTSNLSNISLEDLNGVVQLYKESIEQQMKEQHPRIYALYQNNNYHFTTKTGAGNIFHQRLFNARLNQNKLPAEDEVVLHKNIKKILSGMASLEKIMDEYTRIYDLYERIKNVHGVANDDALKELEKKWLETLDQSKNITTSIIKGLKRIDVLDQQYQEQPTPLLNAEQVNYLVASKSISSDANVNTKHKKIKTDAVLPKPTAVNNTSFKSKLSHLKENQGVSASKKPSWKP